MVQAVVVHGGAGRWPQDKDRIERVLAVLEEACRTGLEASDPVDAVVEAVSVMEDSGVLNAGVGSVLNLRGEREMDAGVMDGRSMKAGAVALVRYPRNPVRLARHVMEGSRHTIIAGEAADRLAIKLGMPRIPPPPEHVIERYKKALEEHTPDKIDELLGDTVGAVALDETGLAAATSTGGLMLKTPGRIGDSPVPGSGFYADDTIAGSATGIGDKILLAQPLARLAQDTRRQGLFEAARELDSTLRRYKLENTLGLIALTRQGEALVYNNTPGIAVAWCTRHDTFRGMLGSGITLTRLRI